MATNFDLVPDLVWPDFDFMHFFAKSGPDLRFGGSVGSNPYWGEYVSNTPESAHIFVSVDGDALSIFLPF